MNDKHLQEIEALKQRIAELENRETANIRSQNLLRALNQAALSLSKTTTAEEIFDTVAEALKILGFTCAIYIITDDNEHVVISALSYNAQAVKAAEKLAGQPIKGFEIPIADYDFFRKPIEAHESCFIPDTTGFLKELLSHRFKNIGIRLAEILKPPPAIHAPLIAEGQTFGILSVQSNQLSPEDMPLLTAFAHQVSSAWHKAQLYQQAQQEIIEREQIQKALLAERDRIKQYLDVAGAIIVALDKEGRVSLINRTACKVLEYEEEEILGKNWFELVITETEREAVSRVFNQLIRGEIEAVEYYENTVHTRSGTQRKIAWHNALLRDRNGKITGTLSSGEDITERLQTEKALRDSEKRFRSIVESSPIGMHMYELGQDDRLIFIGSNPTADQILGVDNAQFIGKTIEEAFPPLAETEVPERYRLAAAEGKPWQTMQIDYQDEQIAGAYEVYAFQTSPGKMVAAFLDITNRQRNLREQERLVSILEATPDIIGTATPDAKLIYLNKAGRQLFGVKESDDLQENFARQAELINEHLRIREEEIFTTLQDGIWTGESTIPDQQGQEIPVSIVLIPHHNSAGELEFISAMIRDIRDLRQAEDLIRLQSTALYSAATGILITNQEQEIIWTNPAITEMTGYELDEMLGQRPSMFSSGQHEAGYHQRISEVLKQGTVWHGELINRKKDGSTYISEQTITPVFDVDGRVTHYISIQQDISERKVFERALETYAAQLALLNDVGEQIVAVLDLASVFQRAVQLVQESFGYHHVGIFTIDPHEKMVVMQAKAGGFDEIFPPNHALKIGQGMVGWAAENNQTLLANDVSTEERYTNLYPDILPTQSEICVPIHIGEKVIGVLDAQGPVKNAFDDSDVIVMQTLADQIAVAIENARLHDTVRKELNERERTEIELRESEERYRLLFERASDAIFMIDPQTGQYLDANLAAQKLSGLTLAELKQADDHNITPDGGLNRLRELVKQSGAVEFGEVNYHRPDGSLRTALLNSVRVKENLAYGIARDITQRKQLDDALRNVVAGVSATTGAEFFEKLVQYLAMTLQVRYAFVGKMVGKERIETIAFCANGKIEDNFEYNLEQSPFAYLSEQSTSCYPHGVQKLFPSDDLITKTNIESYAGTPLFKSTGQANGLLVVMDTKPISKQEIILSLLQIFAVRAAAELERLEFEAEVTRWANQLSALNQMGQLVASSLDIEQVLDQLIHVVPPLVGAEGVSILLRENQKELVFAAASGDGAHKLQGLKIPAEAGIAGQVLKNGQSYLINSQKDQKQLYRDIETVSEYHTQSLLAVPIVLSGETIGVMEAVHSQPNAFTQDDLQVIETAGSWASITINNARQHTATERRLKETQALATINQALNETLELKKLLQLIVDSISQIIVHLERVVIHFYDDEDETLIPAAVAGASPEIEPNLKMQAGEGIAGQVIAKGSPINVRDTQDDKRFIPIEGASYLRSLLVVPVQSSGRCLGTISVSSTQPNTFTPEDEHLLTIIGVQAALAIESARLFDETQQRAQYLGMLNEITRVALQVSDLQELLQTIVDRIGELFQADNCYIALWDEDQQLTIPIASYRHLRGEYHRLTIQPGEKTLTKYVLDLEHAHVIDNINETSIISPNLGAQFPDRALLGLPLISADQKLGSVHICFKQAYQFTPEDINFGEQVAAQIALAIARVRLLEAEKNRRREAETLRDIMTALTATLEIDQVLERILLRVADTIPYDSAGVLLAEGDVLTIVAGRGFEGSKLSIGHKIPASSPVFEEIRTSGQPLAIQDVQKDKRWEDLGTELPIRSWIGIPLIIQENVIGYLTFDNWEPDVYTEQHLGLAQAFGNQASIAIQNARLYAATRRRLAESDMLFYISNLIVDSAQPDVDAILRQVVDQLWKNFGYYHVHVYLFDQASGALIANQGSGPIGAELKEKGYQFTAEEGIVGYAATIGEAFMTNNVDDIHFFMPNPLLPDTSAELAAPLKARDQILGVLDILHRPPDIFDDEDFRFLTTVTDQLAVVLDKALLYNELQTALDKEQKTRDQLVQAEKLAAMGRLIASVAHELNNPLQAIQNALYLVKMEESLSSQATEDLQVAINEGSRMAGLISRLRDTYRPTIESDYKPASINTLVSEVEKLISTHLRHNQVQFQFTPAPNLPKIPMIRDQIKQVILNLCINAIESMPHGGNLDIRSRYIPESQQIHLQVCDSGSGIKPEAEDRIFEPFFTTKEGGTGLGLAVSYELVQNHGGDLRAENNPNQGATFTLSLPLNRIMIE